MNWSIVDKKNYEKWKDFSTVHINKLMWTWHMKFNPFSTNTCNVKAFTLPHAKHVVCLRTLFIFEERQLLENIQSFLNFFFFKLSKQCFSTIFDVYQKRFHEQLCIDNWCYNIHCSYNGKEFFFYYSKLLLMHLHQVSLIEVFWFEQS